MIFIFLLSVFVVLRFTAFREKTMKRAVIIGLCFFLLGGALASVISHYTFDVRYSAFLEAEEFSSEFSGTVTEVIYDGGRYAVYVVDIEKAGDLSDFNCVMSGEGGIEANMKIKGTATFYQFESDDLYRHYISEGILLEAESESLEIVGEGGFSFQNEANKLNISLSNIYYDLLGEDAGGFAAALMLGNKENLPKIVSRDFQRLGLSHVLAISGMHLTIICAFVSTLLHPFGKKLGRIGCIFTIIFYMIITGFSASVTRAGIMLLVLILSSFLRRGGDSFTNLGIAVFLISVIDPFACTDIGLQLSFSAVFAILLYMTKRRPLTEAQEDKKGAKNLFVKFIRNLLEGAVLTMVVVLFMLPLEWLYFGEISLVSPLTSPVFSLGATLLLWTLPILLLLSPASSIASLLAHPVKLFIELIFVAANKISLLRGITFSLNYPFAAGFSIAIFISIIAFCAAKRKKRWMFAPVSLVLIVSFAISCYFYKMPDYERVTVTTVEHKKSDGLMIASENKALIIDIGNGYSRVFNKSVEKLPGIQATEIEVLMLTHIHTSHPATLHSLFSSQIVRNLIIPKEKTDGYYSVVELCREFDIPYMEYSYGDVVNFGDASIKTYENEYIKRSTQPIIRLDISAFDETFTYVGGAYCESVEADLSQCDHILFGSHGPLYKMTFEPNLSDSCRILVSEAAESFISEKIKARDSYSVILD